MMMIKLGHMKILPNYTRNLISHVNHFSYIRRIRTKLSQLYTLNTLIIRHVLDIRAYNHMRRVFKASFQTIAMFSTIEKIAPVHDAFGTKEGITEHHQDQEEGTRTLFYGDAKQCRNILGNVGVKREESFLALSCIIGTLIRIHRA